MTVWDGVRLGAGLLIAFHLFRLGQALGGWLVTQ